jgi:hypothetical protein
MVFVLECDGEYQFAARVDGEQIAIADVWSRCPSS